MKTPDRAIGGKRAILWRGRSPSTSREGRHVQAGPSRLDSAALRAAYSTPPLLPGANIKTVQEAYRRQAEDIRTNYVSVTVRVDGTGRVVSLLACDHVALPAVDPREVTVSRTDKGWSCRSNGKGSFQGAVSFDADGHCTAVSKSYFGPYPR